MFHLNYKITNICDNWSINDIIDPISPNIFISELRLLKQNLIDAQKDIDGSILKLPVPSNIHSYIGMYPKE